MQQTTASVNTGIAPLTNVALCLGTLKRAIDQVGGQAVLGRQTK